MAQLISVKLSRFDGSPWGFRLQGGKDFGTPLIVQKVNGGSPAEQAGLRAGDAVIRVNSTDMFNLRHKDAQDVIVRSGNSFEMTVQRGGSTWRPSVSPVTPSLPSPQPNAPASCVSPVTKTSLAAKKQEAPLIGSGHNFTPKPFVNGSSEGSIKSIVNKQYNSPVGIYSEETIAETLSAQAEVLAGGVLGVNFKKNERNYNAENSEVFKMVQEADKEPKTPEPAEPVVQSGVIMPSSPALAGLRSVTAPETKVQPPTPQNSLPPGQNICADCERLIVGVFVRIKEKNLHVECFKCSTCGTSLKNVGYYNINNKLYCDIHAKLVARQQAPSGLTPITVPPGGKAPAGTISAALTNLGGGAPLSPSLNNHGSPQPYAAKIQRRSSVDLGSPPRRSSRIDITSHCAINDRINATNSRTNNGSAIYDESDSNGKVDCCNAKTYTSTITFRTGNEVGRLADRTNDIALDDNRNSTNKTLHASSSDNSLTHGGRNQSPRSFVVSSSLCSPTFAKINGNNENDEERSSCAIAYVTSYGKTNGRISSDDLTNGKRAEIDSSNDEQKPAVVNVRGVARYQITNQRLKTGTFSSYEPPREKPIASTTNSSPPRERDDPSCEVVSRVNGKEPNDSSNFILGNHNRYQTIGQRLGHGNHGNSFVNRLEKFYANGKTEANDPSKTRNDDTCEKKNHDSHHSDKIEANNRVISGYRTVGGNGRRESNVSGFNESEPPTPPPPPTSITATITATTTGKTTSPSSFSSSLRTKLPNRIGTLPIDTPSFRPVQSHTTNNISGPKPFGGSSIGAPGNFAPSPVQNSANNTLPRPQSQTVTARYYEESDYYEAEIDESVSSRNEQHREADRRAAKSKNLVWPPVKPIEDVTYPTASPIWIDPNPVLEKRTRHNVREKRANLQEASDSRCGSRCDSRCVSRYEDYERSYLVSSASREWENRETSMDRADCSQPFYRKVEVSETRRECRAPRSTSAEAVRRSLTPTRISQPIPKPWVATVTSGTSFYGHVEPPPQPEQETVCTKICQCRIICERTSGPQGPDHEQRHTYREVSCEKCRPPEPRQVCEYSAPEDASPARVPEEPDNEVVDLSKVVPPDVAVCPKGVESQHNLFTETTEKDVGDIHIKKTTIYEKTVEMLSPDRARSPEIEEQEVRRSIEPARSTPEDESRRTNSVTLDREVEKISDRRSTVESTRVLTSAIDTAEMMERAKKEEEAERRECEKIRREEEERLRRVDLECKEQERRYEEEKLRRKERKRVAFGGREEKCEIIEESTRRPEERRYREEDRMDRREETSQERYRELTEEIDVQENFQQLEDQRRRSLREQVEVHQCMREQQYQQPEKRQSLQERRLYARFRDTSADREMREQRYQEQERYQHEESSETGPVQEPIETCQRKHVQFTTETETATRELPRCTIGNSTAKEWKSEMVRALTTAPERPYSPFDGSATRRNDDNDASAKMVYSRQVRYEEKRQPCPAPVPRYDGTERPVSPFQDALTTAPERPYTPLGRAAGEGYDTVICVDRSQTPVNATTAEGYCHPAEILYTDDKTRESRSREIHLRRLEGPRPLPTPPPDYRLRDASASPARSRPTTPKDRSLMTGLKKPGTIPSYQRYLVSMEHEAVEALPYLPSRSPTPNRTKSPGPPEPPTCFAKAHAPRIRESPCEGTFDSTCQQRSTSYSASAMPPEYRECVAYHMEEETPSGHHRAQAYHGMRTSRRVDESRSEKYERREEDASLTVKQRNEHEETPGCSIVKVNRVQPSLSCPLAHCSGSERFPKTGVRVLPPCAPPVSCGQSYETRRMCHEERTTLSDSRSPRRSNEANCPNSGVTIMPCKTTTSTGTKAGIVVMPCEDDDNPSCSRAGICVTPTPDRSGVCVSPVAHGRSTANCSKNSGGPRSGGSTIDIGNCPASGVRVAASNDGSISVGPCSIPGYAPVKCPKPILKSPCPRAVPYPQIPLPSETKETTVSCDSCPLASQSETVTTTTTIRTPNNQSFQPIPECRTNLSNQLTRLTVRRDKQHVVQLFKPQAQSQSQCLITDTVCQTKTRYAGSQNPGPNCNIQRNVDPPNLSSQPDLGSGIGGPGGAGGRGGKFAGSSAPKRGRGILNQAGGPGSRQPLCAHCSSYVRGPFITALGQIWCPEHFVCVNSQCRRALQDIGFVEEKGQLHCEYCFERFIAPGCNKCNNKIKGDCLNAIGKHFHPECFNCAYCGKLFGNSPFFLEDGLPYCEADWNELFTTKCYACGFPVEAGDRWVEALNNNYHSQCFNCTMCKKNLEGQSFYAKGGRPFCKNHAR